MWGVYDFTQFLYNHQVRAISEPDWLVVETTNAKRIQYYGWRGSVQFIVT